MHACQMIGKQITLDEIDDIIICTHTRSWPYVSCMYINKTGISLYGQGALGLHNARYSLVQQYIWFGDQLVKYCFWTNSRSLNDTSVALDDTA